MIKLLRVDHRLLHGQVAFAWTASLQADCILIANDEIISDELKMTAMKLARPNNVKLVIKNIQDSIDALNSGVTEKYNLFIVVASIHDAYRLAMASDKITSINLGGIKSIPGARQISKAIFVTETDVAELRTLDQKNVELEIRQVPNDARLKAITLLG
ncbi:PTS sugar transporter subunit IIB [Buttiauxella sp. A111]|uniref:PTS sugar transporter subunit IIB n=1 Tax=Buttiauxella sp. A111 TaxID=2563088 RepID=UPI0010EBBBA2|nr:PTS sugar transporter subunit IIB [Buttiauxella sp. A111]GDX05163.1 PTS mannose/fructose/sorbose transporter subunit IIB [Buttiauxella sp. A111]